MADKLIFSEAAKTDKTLKVLAIGNSFSQDATTYIRHMALADGVDLRVASAFIGGCSFERHHGNITNGTTDYRLTYYTPEEVFVFEAVSLEQCLTANEWDIITIQQVSGLSGKYETYQPFADELISYVKSILPNAEIRVHMVWAYAKYYPGIANNQYGTQDNMYNRVVESYEKLAKHIGGAKILPSGHAMQIARKNPLVGDDLHRDGFHCSEIGRVLTGWVWFECLTGISALDSKFDPKTTKASYMEDNIIISQEVENVLRNAAHQAVLEYNNK